MQNIVKKDPGRARQNSLATAGTNFTKPGAHNKGDLCTVSSFIILFLSRSSEDSKAHDIDSKRAISARGRIPSGPPDGDVNANLAQLPEEGGHPGTSLPLHRRHLPRLSRTPHSAQHVRNGPG